MIYKYLAAKSLFLKDLEKADAKYLIPKDRYKGVSSTVSKDRYPNSRGFESAQRAYLSEKLTAKS
jgi:hypothetical protein